ncbi:hypothetical protein [Emcibacter sp.]
MSTKENGPKGKKKIKNNNNEQTAEKSNVSLSIVNGEGYMILQNG